ncbi:MAG: FMN-binding protein [Chloroflexota bacterium]
MSNNSRTSYGGVNAVPRRGAVALATTVLAVVLLFAFKPGDQASLARGVPDQSAVGEPTPTGAPVAVGPPQPTRRPNGGGSTASPAPSPTAGSAGGKSGTFTGDATDTPYGTVQIALTVQDGRITDVQELQMPFDRRLSAQISAEAGPILRDQVLRAQSDQINGVSGASYTSYGFYLSLQSALSQM